MFFFAHPAPRDAAAGAVCDLPSLVSSANRTRLSASIPGGSATLALADRAGEGPSA